MALVLTFDGKGIVMLPGGAAPGHREGRRRRPEGKLATRLSPGEKNGRKRMAELAAVYDAARVPRTPGDIITPAQSEEETQAKPKTKGRASRGSRRPRASG